MSEEKKYNIKINPKKPSKQEIKGKMDFKKAYNTYTHKVYRYPWSRFQRHASKNRKVSMFIILIIVIGTLVLIENEKEFNNEIDIVPSTQDSTYIKIEKLLNK